MPIINVEPTTEFSVPYSTDAEEVTTFIEDVAVAANTAELLVEMGAPLETDPKNAEREKRLLEEVVAKRNKDPLKNVNTAYAAAAFLRTYGQSMAMDAAQARAAITHKLMELANCGEPKYELKALELLGKHSDIGLFTERSEITINYNSPEQLENAIKERVKRLLNADIIDVTPLGVDLDTELGVVNPYAPSVQDQLLSHLEEPEDG